MHFGFSHYSSVPRGGQIPNCIFALLVFVYIGEWWFFRLVRRAHTVWNDHGAKNEHELCVPTHNAQVEMRFSGWKNVHNSYYLISTFRVDFYIHFKNKYSPTSTHSMQTHRIDHDNLNYRIVFFLFAMLSFCLDLLRVLRVANRRGRDHWHRALSNWPDLIGSISLLFLLILS